MLPSVQLPRLLSRPSPHRVRPGPIGPGIPSQASSGLVSSLSLLCYRVLISEPLGFTWRALMTSRNERVPPSSNKRLFHVPMLILQESRRFQPSLFLSPLATFRLFFFPRARSCWFVRNGDVRKKIHTYISAVLIYLVLSNTLVIMRHHNRESSAFGHRSSSVSVTCLSRVFLFYSCFFLSSSSAANLT